MIKSLWLAASLLLLASSAQAQDQQSLTAGAIKAGNYLATATDLLIAAGAATMESIHLQQARIGQLETRLHDLEVYATTCGDKLGCFVPVQPIATKHE